ncbi:hypothetical protein BS47DRAFT_1370393 [Hydnum rufescens UP504]|uniref:DNA endonuclease activator Ctp1 C-terminal domain-containing protein n=1 Tax=Hydnum rufescens UP504 TaxID=1448309 RepID=A0A9P6BAT3_9AGAM|nr:hypothetical protein BS47DRAFT_1370393 [Hydnum rufescens UP504]
MTKEEREAHFKQLRSKPYAEYKKAYEAYKGHGRYGQLPTGLLIFTYREDEDDDINSAYELDEARNDGMSGPFDEVVRNKEARQRLHGIDCSCCKAYYEAVGPLPPRLKAPLWKSPTPGQSQPQARRHLSASPVTPSKSRTKAIEDHRQHISRHRHKWIPPATPPDYWKIGFPDTQQTKDINQRAREIRAAKMKRVEEIPGNKADGRYRKKQ